VLSRVEKLADRPADFKPQDAPNYWSLVPLEEIIAEALGVSVATQKVSSPYEALIEAFGNELAVLLDAPIEAVEAASSPIIAEALQRMRAGKLQIEPGYDGQYGTVHVLTEQDRQAFRSDQQTALF
jgi:PHP family Zn ribbon phosphoesterase